jgi:hypothetical protein
MATPVVTVAAGGLPVVDVTATFPKLGLPVTEALNGRGIAVTKVAANGLPVTFKAAGNDWPFPPNPPPTSGGGSASAEATAWLARAPGLDAAHIAADTALIDGLVADGDWASFDQIIMLATQSTGAANLNMVSASYTPTINGAPTFTPDRGYQGVEGSGTIFGNTNFNPRTGTPKYTNNSAHISVWVTTNGTGTAGVGASDGSNSYPIVRLAGDLFYCRINNAAAGSETVANADSRGWYVVNRSGVNASQGYKNGALVVSPNNASIGTPNLPFYFLGWNSGGSPNGYGQQEAIITIGSSLSAAAIARVYNRFRTRLTAVGVP